MREKSSLSCWPQADRVAMDSTGNICSAPHGALCGGMSTVLAVLRAGSYPCLCL